MWIQIAQLIASLSLLVIIHELGHFLFAKLFKCRVEKFYLFFNPWFSIFKFKIGETEYGLGWVPFGGYVKISGMIDESMDTEAMKQPPKPYEFRSKPAWQRLLIMVGGVLMNVILAAVIFIGLSHSYGDSYIAAKDAKYGFEFSELGHEMGFQDGDKILSVEGVEVEDYYDTFLSLIIDQASYVDVDRSGERVRIDVGPEYISRLLKEKGTFLVPRVPFVVHEVSEGGPAQAGGLMNGDTVVGINGIDVFTQSEIMELLAENKGKNIDVLVKRDSAGVAVFAEHMMTITEDGKIGVALVPFDQLIDISRKTYTLAEAIPNGFTRAGKEISTYVKQLKLIFTPETEAYKSVGGFIAIGQIFPDTWSWYNFWRITALLSVMLAVMNILPIPALDGGHVMFLLYEVITRRKPSDKFLERAQIVGLFLLLALLLFANGNDIYKLITKWLS